MGKTMKPEVIWYNPPLVYWPENGRPLGRLMWGDPPFWVDTKKTPTDRVTGVQWGGGS